MGVLRQIGVVEPSDFLAFQGAFDGLAGFGTHMLERVGGADPVAVRLGLPVDRLQVAHVVAHGIVADAASVKERFIVADKTGVDFRDADRARARESRHRRAGMPQGGFRAEPLRGMLAGDLQIHVLQQGQLVAGNVVARDDIRNVVVPAASFECADTGRQVAGGTFEFAVEPAHLAQASHALGNEANGLLLRVELLLEELARGIDEFFRRRWISWNTSG